jgi:hypothetical protein
MNCTRVRYWYRRAACHSSMQDLEWRRASIAASVTEVNGRLVWGNTRPTNADPCPSRGSSPPNWPTASPDGRQATSSSPHRRVTCSACGTSVATCSTVPSARPGRPGSTRTSYAHRRVTRHRIGCRYQDCAADAGSQNRDHDPRHVRPPVPRSSRRDRRPDGPGGGTCPRCAPRMISGGRGRLDQRFLSWRRGESNP